MTEAIPDSPAIPVEQPAEPPSVAGSRLQEYIRSGKFSPAVAAQLAHVMSGEGAQAMVSPIAPPAELFVLETVGNTATGCVLGILALGAVGLGISLSGVIDGYLLGVAGLIFIFVMLGVVAIGSLNQAPPKPRPPKPPPPPKPQKAAKKTKEKKPKPETGLAKTESPAPAPAVQATPPAPTAPA